MPLATAGAAAASAGDDGGQTVRDLLQLLENADSNGLAGFLETEHRELLHLRHAVAQYQEAIAELKGHLHQVFAVAGGLGVLPLSETTRAVLEIGNHPSALQPPMTPVTPGNTAATSKTSAEEQQQPLELASQQLALALPIHRRSSNSKYLGSTTLVDSCVQTEPDALVVGLQQTMAEQLADIEDLETSLRERKTLVRQLRTQLRDRELRQFAAAADCAGLRRTASIMADSLAEDTGSRPAVTEPQSSTSSSSSSEDDSEESDDVGQTTGSDARRRSSRRPSRFINGWPVYDDEANGGCAATATHAPSDADTDESRVPELNELPGPARMAYKQSVASELNADGKSTSSLSKTSTHRLFRSVVAKAPRRMFSSLSNKLKRN
ncbi:hypothetical protein FB645_004271 [Coemansia sp. IMI 203386]|nr:hypothetical protein FB645_004271 [Coemansia sp. IMI 203386]